MLKGLKRYLKERRDIRLKKWCIEMAATKSSFDMSESVQAAAEKIYRWIKGQN
ncbi:hypothetical protein [uncultured Bacteroides sp.]|uniref:hypothetical protein n=1 Tax=uncultured Bacteroides sp. TaxID=162156 RepID=UPI001F9B31BE|nr:hypothetical protein [uncultured Bacteroides sp.]MBU3807887.1 hypothetical protein [Candidatus Phocaeicola faecipullorum]